jgi:hypothetical protein
MTEILRLPYQWQSSPTKMRGPQQPCLLPGSHLTLAQ